MPLTLVNKEVEVVECTKVRGLVQITRDGEMWNCRAVVYNSHAGASTTTMNSDKVVELFKAVGVPQPIEVADSHCVEFFDGPEASVWESFGFHKDKFPATVAEVV
jgi:hypothetical protein